MRRGEIKTVKPIRRCGPSMQHGSYNQHSTLGSELHTAQVTYTLHTGLSARHSGSRRWRLTCSCSLKFGNQHSASNTQNWTAGTQALGTHSSILSTRALGTHSSILSTQALGTHSIILSNRALGTHSSIPSTQALGTHSSMLNTRHSESGNCHSAFSAGN